MILANIKRGDKVVYIPKHLLLSDSTDRIAKENLGVVTSTNDRFAFVQFRGNIRSQATEAEHLYTLEYRQDLAELVDDLPEKTF